MDEKEQLALEWAQEMKQVDQRYRNSKDDAAADYILSQLWQTMENVKFHPGRHRLSGVTDTDGLDHILWGPKDHTHWEAVTRYGSVYDVSRKDISLNGKHYELREVVEGGAKADVITTLAEYTDAEPGTVVATVDCYPYSKSSDGTWFNSQTVATSNEICDVPRRVLRRGWGV